MKQHRLIVDINETALIDVSMKQHRLIVDINETALIDVAINENSPVRQQTIYIIMYNNNEDVVFISVPQFW